MFDYYVHSEERFLSPTRGEMEILQILSRHVLSNIVVVVGAFREKFFAKNFLIAAKVPFSTTAQNFGQQKKAEQLLLRQCLCVPKGKLRCCFQVLFSCVSDVCAFYYLLVQKCVGPFP